SHFTTLTTPASISAPIQPATPLAATPLSPPPIPTRDHTHLTHALSELASVHAQRAGLSYPSVPPPSLASSLGSGSPVVPTLRVPPNSRRQSRGEWQGREGSRIERDRDRDREREGRVAETGSLRRREDPLVAGSGSGASGSGSIPARRRMSTSKGPGDDELEEIGEAYSDEDEDEDVGVLEEEEEDGYEGYNVATGLEIGRGRGRGGRGVMGLGLTGTR
ncbi:hypothetical protein BDV93DRAFT_559255, partial [Ceratobasidium sp. AG-I]